MSHFVYYIFTIIVFICNMYLFLEFFYQIYYFLNSPKHFEESTQTSIFSSSFIKVKPRMVKKLAIINLPLLFLWIYLQNELTHKRFFHLLRKSISPREKRWSTRLHEAFPFPLFFAFVHSLWKSYGRFSTWTCPSSARVSLMAWNYHPPLVYHFSSEIKQLDEQRRGIKRGG